MSLAPSTPARASLLAIDPGRCTGWALYLDRRLVASGTTSVDSASCTARELLAEGLAHLVIEEPRVRAHGKGEGDPNDLIGVAVQVGRWIERAKSRGALVEAFDPHRWKGSIQKAPHHRQARNVLDVYEREIAGDLPVSDTCKAANRWDAIALGLWRLDRIC